ncbi:unnamed protein product [Caenorhabditis brenneri]
MVVQLVLTEAMIEWFHLCAIAKDYHQLFEHYSEFFALLAQHVKKIQFEGTNPRQVIAENLKLFLDILRDWSEGRFSLSCDEIYQVEMDFPNFKRRNFHYFTNPPSINSASVKDWNEFYNRYLPVIDGMIWEARYQGIINFRIECKGNRFEDFRSRDAFLNSVNGYGGSEAQWEPQAAPRSVPLTNNEGNPVFVSKFSWEPTLSSASFLANLTTKIETIPEETSDLEEFSYSLLHEDPETNNPQKVEKFEFTTPLAEKPDSTKTEPLHVDYEEKLARLETEFQMRFQAQEEEIEEFEAQSRILKENSEIYIQQVESRIQEQLKVQEEQIASRESQLKRKEEDMVRKVDEIRRREENMDRKMGEMMEMMKLMVRNTAGKVGSENPSGPVQDTTIAPSHSDYQENNNNLKCGSFLKNCLEQPQNSVQLDQESPSNTPDSGISENNNVFESKVFEVHAFAQAQAASTDFEEDGECGDNHSIRQMTHESSWNLNPTQDQDISSRSSHNQDDIEEQEQNSVDEPRNNLEEESDDNDSIRQMEQKFQRDLASQTQFYEERLRMMREQREEMNRKAEEERNLFYERYGSLRMKK